MSSDQPAITFLLVIRNEVRHVARCLQSMADQTLDASQYEIVVVDGMSDDGTREAIAAFSEAHPERAVRMLDNPHRILSSGWNIGVREARGQYVVRPDAHAEVPRDFLERNLAVMQQHPEAWAVGGLLETRGIGFWGRAIAEALSCRMGVGGSSFRVGGQPGPRETVVFALYRRDKLLDIGGFDETIALNQDNVCHGKITQAGGVLYFDPGIRSTYYCRDSLRSLWRQMFRRSTWLMLMLRHQTRGALHLRYLAPLAFVGVLVALGILGLFCTWAWVAAAGVLAVYLLAGWLFAAQAELNWLQRLVLPLVFLTVHVAYGLGSLNGLVRLPFYKPRVLTG